MWLNHLKIDHFQDFVVIHTIDDGSAIGRVMPGDRVKLSIELQQVIEPGMQFAIREGSHTIGAGVIARIAA